MEIPQIVLCFSADHLSPQAAHSSQKSFSPEEQSRLSPALRHRVRVLRRRPSLGQRVTIIVVIPVQQPDLGLPGECNQSQGEGEVGRGEACVRLKLCLKRPLNPSLTFISLV